MAGATDFAAWLQHTGWGEQIEIEHRLASHASWAEQVHQAWCPFLTRLQKKGFEATPRGSINDAERHAIQAIVAHPFADVERATRFDPLPYDAAGALELPLSLILRQHGKVVGWILGNRQALPAPPVFCYLPRQRGA